MTTIYLRSLANIKKKTGRKINSNILRDRLRAYFTDQYEVDLGRMMPWFDKEIFPD